MTLILKNKNIEILIDHPTENYNFSRFDWTGKIVKIKYQAIPIGISERTDGTDENLFGKGFYNEFGIDTALGFEETEVGGWFHKIGVGLLKKEDSEYAFTKPYKLKPAHFSLSSEGHKVITSCKSPLVNGYSYHLKKEIELLDNGFSINYELENTGEKDIFSDEYVHNFMAINKDLMGTNYVLKFPFQLYPKVFTDDVNPEGAVDIGMNEIKFNGSPKHQFFYSNLTGGKSCEAKWELVNLEQKIGIREVGSFKTDKINLWGWEHVISPELFIKIDIKPGQSANWSRHYTIFKTE